MPEERPDPPLGGQEPGLGQALSPSAGGRHGGGDLDALRPDPANARRHTPRNRALVEAALREVGAARSIVIDEDGTVLAGNATVEAARALGLALRVVEADGRTLIAVRRGDLSPEQKARLALLDNRSAELAEWDDEALAILRAQGVPLADLWTDAELAALVGGTSPVAFEAADGSLATEYRCPGCGFEWSGAPKPPRADTPSS